MASTSDHVHSWSVEYAKSNRSKCQACKDAIEMGAVRIGMEVDNPHVPGKTMFLWHKAGPLFDQFRKGSESKARIKDVGDIAGFGDLKKADQEELEELVRAEAAFREGLSEAEEDTERYEHEKGVFWSIVVAGSTTRVKWGKMGEDAVLSEKSHADEAAAEKFKDKMVNKLDCCALATYHCTPWLSSCTAYRFKYARAHSRPLLTNGPFHQSGQGKAWQGVLRRLVRGRKIGSSPGPGSCCRSPSHHESPGEAQG
jgi:hypothetical protein